MNMLPMCKETRLPDVAVGGADLVYRKDLFSLSAEKVVLPTGLSVLAGIKLVCREQGYPLPQFSRCVIYLNDVKLERTEWAVTLIREGDFVTVSYPVMGGGGGGKSPLRIILQIVFIAAAAAAAAAVGPWAAGFLGETWGAAVGGLAAAAVGVVGALITNAVAPLTPPKLGKADPLGAEKAWSIEGIRNRVMPYDAVPLILGKVRYAPPFAAHYYTKLQGNDQYVRYLYMVMGHNKVTEPRIGDTKLDDFKGVNLHVYERWNGEALRFFSNAMLQEELGLALTEKSGWHTRTTAQNTKEIYCEFVFPRGLGSIDKKGNGQWRSVRLQAEYSEKGRNNWQPFWGHVPYKQGQVAVTFGERVLEPRNGETLVFVDATGNINTSGNGLHIATVQYSLPNQPKRPKVSVIPFFSGAIEHHIDIKEYVQESVQDRKQGTKIIYRYYYTATITFPAGTVRRDLVDISGKTAALKRVGYSAFVPAGQYDVRVRRLTPDVDQNSMSMTVLDESVWSLLRSVKNEPALRVDHKRYPVTVIELEVKATEQLSGHIDEFNVVMESYAPVYRDGKWQHAPSSNPASLALMLATTGVIARPVGMERMDLQAYQGLYRWCEEMGWRFNTVITSKSTAREILHSVLASARASVTDSNGFFSVVWDSPDKSPVYPFGPLNSWGFSSSKKLLKVQPHALRYRFLNEKKDYQEDELIVYADGFAQHNASEIVAAEQDGVTCPDLIYKHGRLRLADSRMRPSIYSFNTDFTFMLVKKGDVIDVTHDVTLWGLAQARIMGFDYAKDNPERITHVHISSDVTMVAGKNYSFIYYPTVGSQQSFPVVTKAGTGNILELPMPIPAGTLRFDGLVHFGIAGRETQKLVVVGYDIEEGETAKIYCQDYAPDVYKALSGNVPDYDAGSTIPDRWQKSRPQAPSVVSIITDEAALLPSLHGSIPCILINFTVHETSGVEVKSVRALYRKLGDEEWLCTDAVTAGKNCLRIAGVEERAEYEFRLYAVSVLGVSSVYSSTYKTTVVGRTTPPPAPVFASANGNVVWWTMPENLPMDIVGYEVLMGMDEHDPIEYALCLTEPLVSETQFDVSRWAGRARRVWIRTVDELGLKSKPVSVVLNLGDVQVDNVAFEVMESARNWPGRIVNGHVTGKSLVADSEVAFMDSGVRFLNKSIPFMGGTASQIVYETYVDVIPDVIPSRFVIEPFVRTGKIASIEYGMVAEPVHFMDSNIAFMSPDILFEERGTIHWKPMPDYLSVTRPQRIWIRLVSSADFIAVIDDVWFVFDVPDAVHATGNVHVPVGGVRLPVPKNKFRWIKNITFGLGSIDGVTAHSAVFSRDEIVEGGMVSLGPTVRCVDASGKPVAGLVNATIQGAGGAYA